MAHAHDHNLVQSLGIEIDHKSPEHDLAVLYLQANAQQLARKMLMFSKKRTSQISVESKHFSRILTPYKLCEYCQLQTEGEWLKTGVHQQVKVIDEATDIKVNDTELEHQITKGEGKFQTLIGFLDLVITAQFIGTKSYAPADYQFERRCMSGPKDPSWITNTKIWKEQPHSGLITISYDGKQHPDQRMHYRDIAIEVKTRHVSLGDAIRQISLYREYYDGVQPCWIFATTVPLDTAYRDALEHEDIRTLLISEDYKHVKQTRAEMETL